MGYRLLDLFSGAGGAAEGYHRAGFDEIVGVDIREQPNYPFPFLWADAMDTVEMITAGDFDAIHASPPCQRWSAQGSRYDRGKHPDYITPLRPILEAIGTPWVIENVEKAPLLNPIKLCGSSFGLNLRRHRNFETSFPLFAQPCAHKVVNGKFMVYEHGKWYETRFAKVYGSGGGKGKEHWAEAMGIDWMTNEEIVEAIPPAYTEFIGRQLIAQLERVAS